MKKRITLSILALLLTTVGAYFYINQSKTSKEQISLKLEKKRVKKTIDEKMRFAEERLLHELKFQRNPITGEIPIEEKKNELEEAILQKETFRKATTNTYITRGPSNLGGRTRAIVIDKSDATGNTMIAGGVSSGVFKTTDGGSNWVKVSSNNEIHNVTTIAQDPRPGFQNIWYYGTGERSGNSASLGSAFKGQGIWKSTDGGNSWSVIPATNSTFTIFDSPFDYVNKIDVSPVNGDLFVATIGKIYRYDGSNFNIELESSSNINNIWTDVEVATNGRVYAAFEGSSSVAGVHTSPTGNGSWTRIAQNGNPTGFGASGRIVLDSAPSNSNILYVLYNNGQRNSNGNRVTEADLWQYNLATDTWTDYSSKLPDEAGTDGSDGNDPFSIQGGYDLVVSVKPTSENFVIIGGTNIYKIFNITSGTTFFRIGGYKSASSYALYDEGGVDHHPDIHAVAWDLNDDNTMFSGTDGGVHKTTNLNRNNVEWENLNNNYLTYQYYHVALDPADGSDIVIGGAQDNGTTLGGTNVGQPDKSTMSVILGGDGVAVSIGEPQTSGIPVLFLGFQNGRIFRRTTGYTEITPDNSDSQFVTYFYLDPDNTNALYYAANDRLYKTIDANNVTSSTWDDAGSLPSGEDIRTIAATRGNYDANNSYIFIGGESGGIFRLKDPQNAGSALLSDNITPSGASTSNNTIVSGIAVHPTNNDIVLAVYSNYGIDNIFLTTNATATSPTWTLVERNLSDHSIRSAAIAEVNGQTQYIVGTARGLYKSIDPTTTDWAIEAPNTIGLAVVSGLVYRPSDNVLLVGTHGNGMFETTLNSTLSLEDNSNAIKVAMYPNPVQFELKFASNDYVLDDETKFSIFDIRGSKVLNGNLNSKSIDVSNLSEGIYIVTLKNDTTTISKKFVKN